MKNFKIFLKSFYITAMIITCLLIALIGTTKAYESIRQIGFGEYRRAIDYENGTLIFFDFTIDLF